jgi:hypothetical protein
MRMMGLAKLCGANGYAKWNNRRNLAAPPLPSVLLIGAAHNAKKAALRLKRPPYPSSAEARILSSNRALLIDAAQGGNWHGMRPY